MSFLKSVSSTHLMCLHFNSYHWEQELSLYQHTLSLYWGNITVKTLCWRPKVPANVLQLVLSVKTVPDPTEQKKEELKGKAEMQLLSVPTSGWDFMGSSSSSFPRMCKCPAMQTFLFCSSSCPMLSQAAFPGRLKINYVQLQLCHQAADWWLQFQDFDKWKKNQ